MRLGVLDVGSNTVHLGASASGAVQLEAFISMMTPAYSAELEGVSADRSPQLVAGAVVAEASMRALSVESLEVCPWALREGSIVRKLDTETGGDLVGSTR